MATKVTALAKSVGSLNQLKSNGVRAQVLTVARRSLNTSFHGPIPPEPIRSRYSVPIVVACIGLGTFVGQFLAKSFAEFLEETDLFVPDDDDDD